MEVILPTALTDNYKRLSDETLRIEAKVSSEKLKLDELINLRKRQQDLQDSMMWLMGIGKKIEAEQKKSSKIITPPGNGKLVTLDQ